MEYYVQKIKENGKIAVDDLILIKDVPSYGGSKILEGFHSLFTAEVVERLEKAGYPVSGTTPVGEFGLDLVGEFSYGHTQKGKLYGAAAELVKKGEVEFALGVDMNGAPRRAAALSGIEFLKPTYGTVSRYGIISCAASGEQIGVYASNAETIAKAMKIIAGHDEKDGTSLPDMTYDYSTTEAVSGKKVALITELLEKADDDVKKQVQKVVADLEKKGVKVEKISFVNCQTACIAWQILMAAETCNNISRYDGVKFGFRAEKYKDIDELYVNSRTEGFNLLTKTMILYGSDVLSKKRYKDCYEKSLRARRLIAEQLNALFEQYAAVIAPVCSTLSFTDYDVKDAFTKVYNEMVFTAMANLTGIPSLTKGAVQFMAKPFGESTLLSLARVSEKEDK